MPVHAHTRRHTHTHMHMHMHAEGKSAWPSHRLMWLQDEFNETPTEASGRGDLPAALQGRSPDTPVMMYCTGGIRCDIYSAYLRGKGFENLYTLEGGVHNYLRQNGGTNPFCRPTVVCGYQLPCSLASC